MRYRLERTEDLESVIILHSQLFPSDTLDVMGQLWLCYDEDGIPVGFCIARKVAMENVVFLNRAGVLKRANGAGLQRRMIRARLRWAKEQGATSALTYTLHTNHASIVNLLKAGFRFYTPEYNWGGVAHYFERRLS